MPKKLFEPKLQYAQDDIAKIVRSLNDAIDVCYNAKSVDHERPDTFDESYPYAVGYSRSAMQSAIESLQGIVTYLNEND